jgi:hypothetical protein
MSGNMSVPHIRIFTVKDCVYYLTLENAQRSETFQLRNPLIQR